MTSLKCWNSNVESNGAAFILSPVECGYVSRDSGAYGKEVSSSSLLSLAREFLIRHAPSDNLFHDGGEAFRVRGLPVVVAERLFVQVAEQVEGLDANVGAVQTAFEQAPEVLHRVRKDIAVHVLDGMIDDSMAVVFIQSIVGEKFITEDSGTRFDALTDQALQFAFAASLDVIHYDLAATLYHSEHDFFTIWPATLNFLRSLGFVHIAGLRADERFIDFDFASEHVKTPVLHSKADAVQHEPSGLLGDAKAAMQFVGTDTVFCPNDEPRSGEPLLKADRGILKDGSCLQCERRAGMLSVALPHASLFQVGNVIGAATRAFDNAILPTQFDHELTAMFKVREPNHRVSESVWRFHVVSMQKKSRYVNYIIAMGQANPTYSCLDHDQGNGLSALASYNYRVLCPINQPTGSFATR
jgi:hypothetical protein